MPTLGLIKDHAQLLFYQENVFQLKSHLKKFLSIFFFMNTYPVYLKVKILIDIRWYIVKCVASNIKSWHIHRFRISNRIN